jgi:choloylglycine hydrolase
MTNSPTFDQQLARDTYWRTMSDHKDKVYYFESAYSPYLSAVNLAKLDFSEGAPTRELSLTEKSALVVDGNFMSGELSRNFAPAQPFRFAGPTAPAK